MSIPLDDDVRATATPVVKRQRIGEKFVAGRFALEATLEGPRVMEVAA